MTIENDVSRNVVIYDDEPERSAEWKESIDRLGIGGLNIDAPDPSAIQAVLESLYERRGAADAGKGAYSVECELDVKDILIVDYDLRNLSDHRGFATGEEIAYAARMYTKIKTIVVVNHPDIGLNDFDLTLQRDRELKGDVYIGYKQMANPALWGLNGESNDFNPWHWPLLPDEMVHYSRCLSEVCGNWESDLLKYFGLDEIDTRPSPEMLSYLGIGRGDKKFSELIEHNKNAPYVRIKDINALLNEEERLKRVITAIVRKWLRRWVLPSQTIVADAPHLASKMPWCLIGYEDAKNWVKLPVKDAQAVRGVPGLFREEVRNYLSELISWYGLPVFFVQPIRAFLEECDEPTKSFEFSNVPKLVFVEDVSRFVALEEAIEYDLTIDGQPQVRAVVDQGKIEGEQHPFDMREIVHVPQSLMV